MWWRFLWPAVLFALALYVDDYNKSHFDRQLLFPFVEVIFPATEDDIDAQAARSQQLLFGFAFVVLLIEAWRGASELSAGRGRPKGTD